MSNTQNTAEPVITEVSDVDMLKYLVKEIGKTKEEIVTEIRERFWTHAELVRFLNKP